MSLYRSGFTIIELLIVVSIIGMLSMIILPALQTARLKGQIARAQADMNQISNAIFLMSIDTGVWPNGCIYGKVYGPSEGGNNEIQLNTSQAGLLIRPTVGVTDALDGCEWTAGQVSSWNGPYIKSMFNDPWGNSYWFDQDYHPRRDCPTDNANPSVPAIAAIVSEGPDNVPIHNPDIYNCDDVYLEIK